MFNVTGYGAWDHDEIIWNHCAILVTMIAMVRNVLWNIRVIDPMYIWYRPQPAIVSHMTFRFRRAIRGGCRRCCGGLDHAKDLVTEVIIIILILIIASDIVFQ